MRKALLTAFVMTLIGVLLTGTALADRGYTSVDQIPMAVDFSVRVDFDSSGHPRIVTDYPFEKTGATEMNLVYDRGEESEVFTLNYNARTGKTSVGSRIAEYDTEGFEKAFRDIRSGRITLSDQIYINTSRFSAETDWLLVYSRGEQTYTEYTERTHAQTFNGMGNGGIARSVYFRDGEIEYSRALIRKDPADLLIEFDRTGDIRYASITRYGEQVLTYDYDPYTGLFSGKKITELGFEDNDMTTRPLAETGTQTSTVIRETQVISDYRAMTKAVIRVAGGLISGIIAGLLLFTIIRRGRRNRREAISRPADSVKASVPASAPDGEKAEESPAYVEPPQTTYSSSGR